MLLDAYASYGIYVSSNFNLVRTEITPSVRFFIFKILARTEFNQLEATRSKSCFWCRTFFIVNFISYHPLYYDLNGINYTVFSSPVLILGIIKKCE